MAKARVLLGGGRRTAKLREPKFLSALPGGDFLKLEVLGHRMDGRGPGEVGRGPKVSQNWQAGQAQSAAQARQQMRHPTGARLSTSQHPPSPDTATHAPVALALASTISASPSVFQRHCTPIPIKPSNSNTSSGPPSAATHHTRPPPQHPNSSQVHQLALDALARTHLPHLLQHAGSRARLHLVTPPQCHSTT